MARSGGGRRMLPIRFAPSQSDSPKEMSAKLTGQTVYWWFRRFVRLLLFCTIHDVALMLDRERAGQEASPSGGILDSQSVAAPHGEAMTPARRSPGASGPSRSMPMAGSRWST